MRPADPARSPAPRTGGSVPDLRVHWHVHLRRMLGFRPGAGAPWHRHLYRMLLCLGRDPRYAPPQSLPPETPARLHRLARLTINRHARLLRRSPATAVPPSGPDADAPRRLFLDVTFTARHDNKSGIQRVIRNLARHARDLGRDNLVLVPVEIRDGQLHPCPRFEGGNHTAPDTPPPPLDLRPGDVFLALDSGWGMVSEYQTLFLDLHARGVVIVGVVYDIIPITHLDYFRNMPLFTRSFAVWLGLLLAYSRSIVCISKTTRDELAAYAQSLRPGRLPAFDYFHLGFDRAEIRPPSGPSSRLFSDHRFNLLMVGTLERRKGYDTALDAFDILVRDRTDIALHIVGKPGLNADDAITRIQTHPLLGKSLFWHVGAGDDLLAEAYARSQLLIAASRAEGFGLPLVEAAQVGLPVVASNLPVFTEIAGDHVYYFPVDDGEALATVILTALADIAAGTARRSSAIPVLTWRQSGDMLVDAVAARLPTPAKP